MILAQLTDTHLKAGGRLAYRRVDTAGLLAAAVRHVNRLIPPIDAVIMTGDLTDGGQPEEYQAVRAILDELAVPAFVIPGNHDDRRNLLAAFGDRAYLSACDDFVHYAVDDYPVRLIGLDTTVPGEPHGFLCEDRLAWLDRQLAAAPDRPAVLFQHHPPFVTSIRHMDVQNLRNAEALFAVLARHAQVRHIACGHVHRASETVIGGIGVSIAPNAAHAVTLDLSDDGPSTFVMEPPAVRLLRVADDGSVVSHLSFVGQFAGPFPFHTEDGSLID